MKFRQVAAICSMVSGVCMSLIAQAHLLGDRAMHIIAIIGVAATAIGGGLLKLEKEWQPGDADRRDRP